MKALRKPFWAGAGLLALALGIVGIALPLLPTVPFFLLAAFCFARSHPVWEQRLLDHPRYGPPLHNWRKRRAISRPAKLAALTAMAATVALSAALLGLPWALAPAIACMLSGVWIWTRPE